MPYDRGPSQFVGMGMPELRQIKQLTDKSGKYERLIADMTLAYSTLQNVLKRHKAQRRQKRCPPPSAVKSPATDKWSTASAKCDPPASGFDRWFRRSMTLSNSQAGPTMRSKDAAAAPVR